MASKPRNPQPSPPLAAQPSQDADTIKAATEILFPQGENSVTLRSGRVVTVQHGKVKHTHLLLDFFNSLLAKMDRQQVVSLVEFIQEQATKKKPAPKAPGAEPPLNDSGEVSFADDIAGITSADELASTVKAALDRSGLLMTLLYAVNDVLPKIVGQITDISEIDFNELDPDEGAVVAYKVYEVNYAFFSRTLPPMLRLFLSGAARKSVGG